MVNLIKLQLDLREYQTIYIPHNDGTETIDSEESI